jgi:hypothetical protein
MSDEKYTPDEAGMVEITWLGSPTMDSLHAGVYAEMLAMLKELEWSGQQVKDYSCGVIWNTCPSCHAMRGYDHDDTCELSALIAKAEGNVR